MWEKKTKKQKEPKRGNSECDTAAKEANIFLGFILKSIEFMEIIRPVD